MSGQILNQTIDFKRGLPFYSLPYARIRPLNQVVIEWHQLDWTGCKNMKTQSCIGREWEHVSGRSQVDECDQNSVYEFLKSLIKLKF